MPLGSPDVKIIKITPTITSGSAYSTGFQVGTLMTLTQAAPDDKGGCVLHSACILDKDKQDISMDLFIFYAAPTVTSTDRTAANITDANMVDKCLGVLQVTTYADLSANSVGFTNNGGLVCAPKSGVDLFCLAVIRGTATYTSTSALEFTFNFLQGTGR